MSISRMLTKAALADNPESIRRLIRQDQDVHGGDDEALYVAVYMGNKSATRALLLAGADPTARDYSIIALAAKNQQGEIGALLSRYMSYTQRKEASDKLEEEMINVHVIRQYGLLPRLETEQQSLLNQLVSIGG